MASSSIDRLKQAAARLQPMDEMAAKRNADANAIALQSVIGSDQASRQNVGQLSAAFAGSNAQAANQATGQSIQNIAQVGGAALQAQGQNNQLQLQQSALANQQRLASQAQSQQQALQSAEQNQQFEFTEKELQQQAALSERGMYLDDQISFMSRNQREQLNKLGNDIKSQLFDSRLMFEREQESWKFGHQLQLLDWAATNAKDEAQFKMHLNSMQNAARMDMIATKAAHDKLTQELQQSAKNRQQVADQEHQRQLYEMQQALAKKMADKQKKAGMMSTLFTGVASGAAAGATIAPPWGMVVGAAAGGTVAYAATK